MQSRSSIDNTPIELNLWRGYLALAILQGLPVLWWILRSPSEKGSLMMGLSPTRLAFAAGIFVILGIFGWLLVETWRQPVQTTRRITKLATFLQKPGRWGAAFLSSVALVTLGCFWITLLPEISEPFSLAIMDRLLPIVVWFTGLCLQTLLALLYQRHGPDLFHTKPRGRLFLLILAIVAVSLLAWMWVAENVFSYESHVVGWNFQGVPLPEIQVFLAWGLGMALLTWINRDRQRTTRPAWLSRIIPGRIDWVIAAMLWLCSVLIWQAITLPPSWFVSQPTAPNFEYYPTSDGRFYDTVSQVALTGGGYKFFNSPFIRRPVHAMYLTVLHVLGGQDYEKVIFQQIILLAFLPVGIYFVTRALHTRSSALLAASLVMLREANSIAISGNITASHAKVLLVDLPTALAIVVFTYLSIQWLLHLEEKPLLALISGGVLGMTLLVRFEAIVLLFPLAGVMAALLFPRKLYGLWAKHLLIFTVGVLLVLSPWIGRNWGLTGQIFIDSPLFRSDLIAQRFRPTYPIEPEIPSPVEVSASPAPQATAIPVTPTPIPTKAPVEIRPFETAASKAVSFIWENPSHVVSFMAAHYLNSELQTLLTLPSIFRGLDSTINFMGHRSVEKYWEECCSLKEYIRRAPYWRGWDGRFLNQSILPILVNIVILAAGIQFAWNRRWLIGLLPLLFMVTYLAANAIFRNSGGRYILPVDWVVIVYFSIGLAQLSIYTIQYTFRTRLSEEWPTTQPAPQPLRRPRSLLRMPAFYIIAAAFFLAGLAIPFVERSFPNLYPTSRQAELLHDFMNSNTLSTDQSQGLDTFLNQGGIVDTGRAIYPQFLPPDAQNNPKRNTPLPPRSYPRIEFTLVNPKGYYDLHLPVTQKPAYFPDASDVLVFRCPDFEVLAVALLATPENPGILLVRSPQPATLSCPLE